MAYEDHTAAELEAWKKRMLRKQSFTGDISEKVQGKINSLIPAKVHEAITSAIRNMTKAFLFGAEITSPEPLHGLSAFDRDLRAGEKIRKYRNTATAEGAITGAGGILLGLADFPIWLGLKLKMLTEISAIYGHDVSQLKERIFILHIFEMTFSRQNHRRKVFALIDDWKNYERTLPEDINAFDWRAFQQQYRDYIDIAKLLQLVPGIGAAVGAVVNHNLTGKLGDMAVNAYRLRASKQGSQDNALASNN